MKKFTFRKMIHTGPYRSFQQDQTEIKLDGKVVGSIDEIDYENYSIGFMIKKEKTGQDPAPFKWIRFIKRSKSEAKARDLIKKDSEKILSRYDLYWHED